MYSFQIISQDDGSFSFSMMIDNTWQLGTYKVFTITNGEILGPVIFSVQEKLDQIIDPLTRQSKFGIVSIDLLASSSPVGICSLPVVSIN